jgi:hypothetical protein
LVARLIFALHDSRHFAIETESMKLTRRRKVVLALVAVMAVAGWLFLFPPWAISIKDARRIYIGMPQANVFQILGPPSENISQQMYDWQVADGIIYVVLKDNVVESVAWHDYTRWDRFCNRIRYKLGINPITPVEPVWLEW